jgi:hypothetical protein
MKLALYFAFVVMLGCSVSSCHRSSPLNDVSGVSTCDTEILIRNWESTSPDTLDVYSTNDVTQNTEGVNTKDIGDNLPDYKSFAELFNQFYSDTSQISRPVFSRNPSIIQNDYLKFKTGMYDVTSRYLASEVYSNEDQDVAFITGSEAGMQMWVNQRSVLRDYSSQPFGGYQHVIKVHLNKGHNFVLVKLIHLKFDFHFLLKISSLKYANENSIGANFASFCKNYLINPGDSLKIKIWSPIINLEQTAGLEIRDIQNKLLFAKRINPAKEPVISLKGMPEGPYDVKLISGKAVFDQKVFYGNYKNYITTTQKQLIAVCKGDKEKDNAQLQVERFNYLDTVTGVAHDNNYERKVSATLFEIGNLYEYLSKGADPFKDAIGLHIRAQVDPEYKADSYMVYIPSTYKKDKPMPLVVMMPYETGLRHFEISSYVADINRIEHIEKLAEKYNYAVLWSSYRVYKNPALIPMVPHTVFETINDLKKDYNIDTNRTYAYGSCAGGELALSTANKFPSFFAAVGVEGPAIPDYVTPKDSSNEYRSQQELNNDFYNNIENYFSFPTLIIHSRRDEKCQYEKSAKLVAKIDSAGGSARLQTLDVRKGLDLFFLNVMPDNTIMSDFFRFFHGISRRIPDTVIFSTWQLKYNQSYWLSITNKVPDKKAYVKAIIDQKNKAVNITSENVWGLSLNPAGFKKFSLNDIIKVNWNGKSSSYRISQQGAIKIDINTQHVSPLNKISETEGPVNDFFTKPFLIVKGTKGDDKQRKKYDEAIDGFSNFWKVNFFEDTCRIKNDVDITASDITNFNLLLVGDAETNSIISRYQNYLPVKSNNDYINIGSATVRGHNLSYLMIYPNPNNTKKYILFAGSNYDGLPSDIFNNSVFNGWYDYEVLSTEDNVEYNTISSGYFDKTWK